MPEIHVNETVDGIAALLGWTWLPSGVAVRVVDGQEMSFCDDAWCAVDGVIEVFAAEWRPDISDYAAWAAANQICEQRGMYWKAHSPTQFGGDTEFWFAFDRVPKDASVITWGTGWPRYGEYAGHGATLAGAICAALLALKAEAT
jgi:hypothetical protein